MAPGTFIKVLPLSSSLEGLTGDWFLLFLRTYFVEQYRPLRKGDTFEVHAHMRDARFKVIETRPADYIIVESNTIIDCEGDPIKDEKEEREDEEGDGHFWVWFDDIGGYNDQIAEIRRLVELPLRHPELWSTMWVKVPRGILLHGPMGTGKTLLARAIANETGAYFFVLNGSEIFAKDLGESELILRQAFAEAETKTPAIIFIDEIDVIAQKKAKTDEDLAKRLVSQLNLLMDQIATNNRQITVIGATNRSLETLDPSLRRFGRFSVQIEMRVPSEIGRLEILRILTKKMPIDDDVDLEMIASETQGFVGADLASLCTQAAIQALMEQMNLQDLGADEFADVIDRTESEVLPKMRVKLEHFRSALASSSCCHGIPPSFDPPKVTWDEFFGSLEIKKELRESIEWLEIYRSRPEFRSGPAPSKGVLLYGPPGCGKYFAGQALANDCQANFIYVNAVELLNDDWGKAAYFTRDLFQQARDLSPCILFIKHLDDVCNIKGKQGEDLMNQLLNELDNLPISCNVFCIASSNKPDRVDPAFAKPGRLDQLIYVPLPDTAARLALLRFYLRKCMIRPDVDLDHLSHMTFEYSCRDLLDLCHKVSTQTCT